jgi:hypothetical protein
MLGAQHYGLPSDWLQRLRESLLITA